MIQQIDLMLPGYLRHKCKSASQQEEQLQIQVKRIVLLIKRDQRVNRSLFGGCVDGMSVVCYYIVGCDTGVVWDSLYIVDLCLKHWLL